MSDWPTAFLFTETIEIPIYAFALRGRLGVAFGASAITHPIVWFVIPVLVPSYMMMVVVAETFAVLAEALWLRRWGLSRALEWSFAANMASFGLGLTCRALWGVP
jgi:hypothetical protein